jgi:hypothetical protein
VARLALTFCEQSNDSVRALPGAPTPILSATSSDGLYHAMIYPTDAECKQIIGVLQAHLDAGRAWPKRDVVMAGKSVE